MRSIQFDFPAPDGELFAPDAFQLRVGENVGLRVPGMESIEATLTDAVVSDCGTFATLSIEFL